MKMYMTNALIGLISKGSAADGSTTDARGTSWLTGFTLSVTPFTHHGTPVTSGAGSQPFGRKHRF